MRCGRSGELPPRSLSRVPARPTSLGTAAQTRCLWLYRCVGRLSQNAPHMPVSLSETGRWPKLPHSLLSRATSHPRRHLVRGRKRFRRGPTSAIICCAESAPSPGTCASLPTESSCCRNASGRPVFQRIDLRLQQRQPLQKQLQNLPLQTALTWLPRSMHPVTVPALAPESRCRQRGYLRRIRLPLSHCLQHPSGAQTQQIAHMTRKLDPRLFQKPFHLVLQPHPVTDQLLFGPCHGAPQPLLRIRHETQDQFSGNVPPHQPFGTLKSRLRPLGALLECACARCSLYLPSSACQTGFQYCAVDSITASFTSCSASQWLSKRRSPASVPNLRFSNRNSPAIAASVMTTPASFCGHRCRLPYTSFHAFLSGPETESVPENKLSTVSRCRRIP